MAHKIIEAIIEDGQLKYVGDKLPKGRLNVHLVYDLVEGKTVDQKAETIIAETSGIYKDLHPELEAKKLRMEWERKFQ
jgi:predicted DNA-binding antitoxin AbrB/MazE fold protein